MCTHADDRCINRKFLNWVASIYFPLTLNGLPLIILLRLTFLECIHTRTVLTTRYALWISLFPLQHHSGFGYTVSFIFNVICFAWAEHVHKPFIWFECIFFYVYITLLCFICVFCHANIVWKNRGMKGEIKVNKTLQVQTLVSIFWDVVAATTTAASASRMQEFKKVLNSLLFVVIWMWWLHIWAVLWLRYAIALTVWTLSYLKLPAIAIVQVWNLLKLNFNCIQATVIK